MLHTLITDNASIRDALVSRLSLKKRNDADAHHGVTFYQKESWILAYHPTALDEAQTQAQEEYNPSRIYALFLGASIDVDHEIGDVVLPNVFFYYTPEIATTEITESNRDHIWGTPLFLDIYETQRDYYVENFWLSIGGIAVFGVPTTPSQAEKLMMVYEADLYTESRIDPEMISHSQDTNTVFVGGIIQGKIPNNNRENHLDFLAENIITTIGLLEDEAGEV